MKTTTGNRNMRRSVAIGLVVLSGLVAAGCSTSIDYPGGATKLIEGELEEKVGLGELTATCGDVADDVKVGDTFVCTAETTDGDTVEFLATVAEDDKVNVDTTNLITADGMTVIENGAVSVLEQETGATIGEGALECGEGPRVIDVASETLDCVLTSPDTGDKYETTITLDGLSADSTMNVVVADQPMG